MARLKLQSDEQVLLKSPIGRIEGEMGIMNLLKGRCRVTDGIGYLTTHRLVIASKLVEYPWGPLIWLIRAALGRKILFEIPLSDVVAATKGNGASFKLQTVSGEELQLASNSLFNKSEAWVQQISEAISTQNRATIDESKLAA